MRYLAHVLVLQLVKEGELKGEDGVAPRKAPVDGLNSLILLDFREALPDADVKPFPLHLCTHPDVHQLEWIGEKVSQSGKPKGQNSQSFLALGTALHRDLSDLCRHIEQPHLGDEGHISSEVGFESVVHGERCMTTCLHTIDLCCLMSPSEKVDWICLMVCSRSSG